MDLHVRAAASVTERAGERYAELVEVIAWHLARAAKLEPDPARQAAAFEATIDASEHAALRGPTPRPSSCSSTRPSWRPAASSG